MTCIQYLMTKNKNKQKRKQPKSTPKKPSPRSTILRDVLSYGGGALGGYLGGPIGASAGTSLGRGVSRWLGAGDYAVSSNTLALQPKVLAMHTNDFSVRVVHKEFICDIISSATANAYKAQGFSINPGLSNTFPWLSALAQQFQQWQFKGCIFEFVSTTSEAIASSTNSTVGSVMMGSNYRSPTTDYPDKITLLSSYFSNDAKASDDFCHPLECDPKENPFAIQYVRGGPQPPGEDIKMYDLARLTVASSGVQGTNVVLGELWVTYDVELNKPIDTISRALYSAYAHWNFSPSNTNAPFSANVTTVYDSIGLTFDTTHVFLPAYLQGTYMMIITMNNTTLSGLFSGLVIGTLNNVTAVNSFGLAQALSTVNNTTGASGGTNAVLQYMFTMTSPSAGGSIGVTGPNLAIISDLDVIIIQVNGTLAKP